MFPGIIHLHPSVPVPAFSTLPVRSLPPLTLKKKKKKILLLEYDCFSVVLVSAVQQSESAVFVCVYAHSVVAALQSHGLYVYIYPRPLQPLSHPTTALTF